MKDLAWGFLTFVVAPIVLFVVGFVIARLGGPNRPTGR